MVSSLRQKDGHSTISESKHLQKGLKRVQSSHIFAEPDTPIILVLEDLWGMQDCKTWSSTLKIVVYYKP